MFRAFVKLVVAVLFACSAASAAGRGSYFPGLLPNSYATGQELNIRVNSLTSNQGVLPYNFYSFKTCTPTAERFKEEKQIENLGEILWGHRVEPSEYSVKILKNITCQTVCSTPYDADNTKRLEMLIDQQYRGNMNLDRLPVAQPLRAGPRYPNVLMGYPMGTPSKYSTTKKTEVNNHLHFTIAVNDDVPESDDLVYRIVGFYVTPYSVDYQAAGGPGICADGKEFNPEKLQPLATGAASITWTFSVTWIEEPDLIWATRWDIYTKSSENDDKIHWFSIVNSLLIILFLSTVVAMIMLRTLHKDFNRYNDPDNEDSAKEETGWKNVHGDVFRAPEHPVLLSGLVSSGAQLVFMIVVTLLCALVGFLAPANRGALLTIIILVFVLLGALSGYVGARQLKFFKQQSWRNAFSCSILLPASCMGIYLTLNLFQWYKHASSAIPFSSLLLLFALWMLVALPLNLVGASVGFRAEAIQFPCHVNPLPRFVPPPRWYLSPNLLIPVTGLLPFGAAFIELAYIMSSFWQGRIYYMFGFLGLVLLIVCITCAEVTVVLIYFTLCHDDYHWWWKSLLAVGSSGAHIVLYSVYYLFAFLTIRQPTSIALYLGYMFLAGYLFAIFTGCIGYFSAFVFVRKIYASIKID